MAKSNVLESLTDAQIERELAKRARATKRNLDTLNSKRVKLLDSLSALDAKIAEAGGVTSTETPKNSQKVTKVTKSGSRAKNGTSLNTAVLNALQIAKDNKDGTSIKDITAAVLAGGYKSGSDNFSAIVNQSLNSLKKDGAVKAVKRGMYVRTAVGTKAVTTVTKPKKTSKPKADKKVTAKAEKKTEAVAEVSATTETVEK